MTKRDDITLLREFTATASESAFAALVERHIGLVYSTAMRRIGNTHAAEEITQAVFIILAQKAGQLSSQILLSGWLYQTARLTTANYLRSEIRRQKREQESYMQSALNETDANVWPQMAPLLDDALGKLGEQDRNALVLRFFENKSLAEVGIALGASEDAAKMRVNRALEKLRKIFTKRGLVLPLSALAGVMATNSAHAVPPTLANSVTAMAMAKGAASSGSTLTLIKGVLKIMAWTKAKMAVGFGVGLLLTAGIATVTVNDLSERGDTVRAQVLEIIQTNGDDSYRAADMIAKIGPQSLPTLEQLIRWKKSWWDFSAADKETKLRRQAVAIVANLGPAAVRPLTGALCSVVNDPNLYMMSPNNSDNLNTIIPACASLLEWSVPDSPLAVTTLTNWLLNPAQRAFIDNWNNEELFSRLPNAAPLLVPWLKNSHVIRNVAPLLGAMGTNAAIAIPALIKVVQNSFDTTQPALRFTNSYWWSADGKTKPVVRVEVQIPSVRFSYMTDHDKLYNPTYAVEALGKIGIASPEVVETLQQALADGNDLMRFSALKSLYALHQQPEKPLADVLNTFSPRRGTCFNEIINWAGSLGEEGRDALPWLHRLTGFYYVQTLPEGVHTNLGNDLAVSIEHVRASAILSVCEIDPLKLVPSEVSGVDLYQVLSSNDLLPLLRVTKRIGGKLNESPTVALLTPQLRSTNTSHSALAAQIILKISPDNQEALQILHRCASEGNLVERVRAAEWLKERTGNLGNLLDLLIEALNSEDSFTGQIAAIKLRNLGLDGRPAIPALKKSFWNQDVFVRTWAGRALEKIAPEELPAIR